MSHSKDPRPGKLFIGGLDERVQKEDLQKFFANAGELEDIWIARKPPGFGFIQFRDPRDAEDAIRDLDGKEIMGKVIALQISDGRARMRPRTLNSKPTLLIYRLSLSLLQVLCRW